MEVFNLKRTIVTLAILAIFVSSIIPAFSAGKCSDGMCTLEKPKAAVSKACPVMGKKIQDVSKASGKSTYKGKTYYFCCPGCKTKFDKNPQKYIKTSVSKSQAACCMADGKKCNMTPAQCAKMGKACPMGKSKSSACPLVNKKAAAKKPVSAVCPVMKTRIPDVSKASGKSVYKGKTYYFCCAGCKEPFDKNPEKYIKK